MNIVLYIIHVHIWVLELSDEYCIVYYTVHIWVLELSDEYCIVYYTCTYMGIL